MGDRVGTMIVARGRWKDILPYFGIHRKFLTGRHMPCPACGGTDRFRFTDRFKDGDYYCNQCGAGKGIKLVMKVNNWDYRTAAARINLLLRNDWRVSMSPENRPSADEVAIPKSTRDCALWIRKRHPEKLEQWLEGQCIEVKWWLEDQPA